jgi:hypothetical protein
MSKFTNPLADVKVASPCPANWNEMHGDERKRYCSACKLNVYNLSDMTRREAENFIINTEGRVCVKFYRRADGSVLTRDCPVGWRAVKRKISRTAQAFASICAGIFGGIFAFNQFQTTENIQSEVGQVINVSEIDSSMPLNKLEDFQSVSIPSIPINEEPASDKIDGNYEMTVGMMMPLEKPDRKVIKIKKSRR